MIQKLKNKLLVAFALSFLFMPAVTMAAAGTLPGDGCKGQKNQSDVNCLSHNKIITDITTILNILTGVVVIVIIIMIMIGGIQYAMARDDSGAVGAARKRIANAVIAFVMYALLYAFLQWLIPGGVLNNK
jgi:hypothetical protein